MRIKNADIVFIASLAISCLYPMSKDGQLMTSDETIIYYVFGLITVLFILIKVENIQFTRALFGIAIIIYLEVATLISNAVFSAEFSIARFAPIAMVLMLFAVNIKQKANISLLKIVLEIITIIIILWNALLVFQVEFVQLFTINHYSQFMDISVPYQVLVKQLPVFTFGVHSYASFYYTLIFFMWYITQKSTNERRSRYYIYLLFMIVYTIMLKSTTSLFFSVFMVIMFSMLISKSKNKIIFWIITTCLIGYLLTTHLVDDYLLNLLSSEHGFLGRYSSETTLFDANWEILSRAPLGIGFTIPELAYFADSGFFAYILIGGPILLICIYVMLYKFLKTNAKQYSKLLFVIIIAFEFALSSLTYMKTILFILAIIIYINALPADNSQKKVGTSNA